MTKKTTAILSVLIASALLASCGDGFSDRLTSLEVQTIEDYVMSSYFIQRGDAELPESRAAWNAYSDPIAIPTAASVVKQNYPEKGQRTEVTATATATAGIYTVENITTYPRREDSITRTVESYLLKDNDNNNWYTDADLILDPDTELQDFNKRIAYKTEYADGSTRYESVKATTTEDSVKYAAFDIDGSLSFPSGTSYAPATDASANYSSMVSYVQEELSQLDFWSGNKIIVGSRYYTEHGDLLKPTKTSVSYERVYSQASAPTNLEAQLDSLSSDLFTDSLGTLLAETVIRYQITSNGRKTVNTRTQLYDGTTQATVVTFTAQYITDEDGNILSQGVPVAVY